MKPEYRLFSFKERADAKSEALNIFPALKDGDFLLLSSGH